MRVCGEVSKYMKLIRKDKREVLGSRDVIDEELRFNGPPEQTFGHSNGNF